MKSKILSLFAFSILAVVFLMSFASAALTFDPTSITQTIPQGQISTTFDFNLTNSDPDPLILTSWTISQSTGVLFLSAQPNSIDPSEIITITATLSGIPSDFEGTITGNINVANSSLAISKDLTFTINVLPQEVFACNAIGNDGDLNIKDIEFTNNGMQDTEFGSDDEWFPLDDIEVDIEIENDGNDDVDDISVEWGIYNTQTNEWVIEIDEEDEINLGDGKDEIINVNFNLEGDIDVNLEDLTNGKDYRFYVIATGDVDDGNLNPQTCVSDFDTVEVIIENDFVALNDIRVPETAQCGADVQVSAEVWNIGEDDQDEVSVEIHNIELGLFHKVFEIGDIDAFEDDAYVFNFQVPSDAEEKFYGLEFRVLDEDLDVYETDHDDDESRFVIPLQVTGGCSAALEDVVISANIQSGGEAGDELVVRATITNNEDELKTFTINAAGFAQWADSVSTDQSSLVLNAGESRDILFTFDVNKDASGSQTFTIELVSTDNQVITQPVSVAIEPRSGFGFTGNVISGENLPWVIGALNILLVVIIIIVAVKVAKR